MVVAAGEEAAEAGQEMFRHRPASRLFVKSRHGQSDYALEIHFPHNRSSAKFPSTSPYPALIMILIFGFSGNSTRNSLVF